MTLTDSQCSAIYDALDEYGRDFDPYYGLPAMWVDEKQRPFVHEVIRKAAGTAAPAPLPADQAKPGTVHIEGYGYIDLKAVRAVERAHGIGE
jgi:hypothetical protein